MQSAKSAKERKQFKLSFLKRKRYFPKRNTNQNLGRKGGIISYETMNEHLYNMFESGEFRKKMQFIKKLGNIKYDVYTCYKMGGFYQSLKLYKKSTKLFLKGLKYSNDPLNIKVYAQLLMDNHQFKTAYMLLLKYTSIQKKVMLEYERRVFSIDKNERECIVALKEIKLRDKIIEEYREKSFLIIHK
jgi:hypothetical protein